MNGTDRDKLKYLFFPVSIGTLFSNFQSIRILIKDIHFISLKLNTQAIETKVGRETRLCLLSQTNLSLSWLVFTRVNNFQKWNGIPIHLRSLDRLWTLRKDKNAVPPWLRLDV